MCHIESPLLKEIISSLSIHNLLSKYLDKINISSAKNNDILNFLNDITEYPNIGINKRVIIFNFLKL